MRMSIMVFIDQELSKSFCAAYKVFAMTNCLKFVQGDADKDE